MVRGQVGPHGLHVVRLAELVSKTGKGLVPTPDQHMAENIV